ncbi:MAG TPA: phosphoglycerate kinase [Acidimicrobiia bacterium]
MNRYLTLDDVDVEGLRVLVRSDLNVPIDQGHVGDDFRIRSALPTLERLLQHGASVTVCSHLGRPEGPDPAYSLEPVAKRMDELTERTVSFNTPGDITVMENTRFLDGETANDRQVAERLADDFELFVQDAFGSVHRAHASTVGVAEIIKSVAGPLLDDELKALGRLLANTDHPYTVVLGGAKVSDKLGVIDNLLPKVDRMLIGGGMCFTFLAARGNEVGDSLVEESMLDTVNDLASDQKIVLPDDVVIGDSFSADSKHQVKPVGKIPEGWMGLDIGPDTSELFAGLIRESASVFWNGPMGVFEWEPYRSGTEAVARAMGECEGFTAVGGGDSAAALRLLGLEDTVSHLSTGGGASLELLEGEILPGVAVLERWVQ